MIDDLGWITWQLIAAVQVMGLSAAWLTRMEWADGTRGVVPQLCCYLLFYASMAAVAGATMVALAVGDGGWVLPAGTLGIMIVAATCDFRHPAAVTPY